MAEVSLSKDQENQVIDFLKRWGIDSPELLLELTDHYREKASDRMAEGWSFERVMDSWKTKSHFLTLKNIQREFEQSFKKRWSKSQLAALKTVFSTSQLIWVMTLIGVIALATYQGFGIVVLGLCAAISALYYLVFAYFYWIRKYQRIFEIRDNLVGGLIFYWIIYHFFKSLEADELSLTMEFFQWKTVLLILFVVLSFYQYNLYSKLWQNLKGLTEEYLVEHEVTH